MVPKEEIVENEYDLSINKYKKVEYVAVEYPPTSEIMENIKDINMKLVDMANTLEKLLEE
jgi:type I restriction enzyme M protein